MANYTKRGHKLEWAKDLKDGLIFKCSCRFVSWTPGERFGKGQDGLLAQLQVVAPCTHGEMVATLRAWLSVYGDDELLGQVEGEVDACLASIKDIPSDAAANAQRGQLN